MLLLVTIGLVVVGAVALVIGFVSNSLGPIYLSIACSVIAGIVLVVFSRMARRQESSGAGPSTPSRPSSWGAAPSAAPSAPPSPPPTRVDIPAAPPPVSRPAPPRYEREPEPEPTYEREPVTAGFAPEPDEMPEDDGFPIRGYDRLRASQIVDHLPELTLDELDMVREREEQGKNRATIIRRVDMRIDELEAAESAAVDLEEPEPEFEPEPELAPLEAEPVGAAPGPADDGFPIEDYDLLSSDEIIGMLDDLSDDELDMVAAREERGRNRVEILEYIDDMFEEVPVEEAAAPPPVAPPPPPAPRKAPAKKAAAKKAAAAVPAGRKAAAKKAAPVAKVPLAKATGAGRGAKKAAAPAAPAAASPGTKAAGRTAAAKAGAAKAGAAKAGAAKASRAVKAAKAAAPVAPVAARKAAKKAAAAKKRP